MYYMQLYMYKVEIVVGIEIDFLEMVNEMVYMVRKGGRLFIIGVYVGYINYYNLGGFMEKYQIMRGGQIFV